MSKRLLCLDMGGTIAQIRDEGDKRLGYQESSNDTTRTWDYLTQDQHRLLDEIASYEYKLLSAKDSTEVEPNDWITCAKAIHQARDDFSGFVITHGTDTLTYTAAALSFMLCDLEKPIAVTGSQIPIRDPKTFGRSDGWNNLVSAFLVAATSSLSGVCVVFGSRILRGSRVQKVHSSDFTAFDSPNAYPLGYIGLDIKYPNALEYPRREHSYNDNDSRFRLNQKVELIKIFPGMRPDQLRVRLKNEDADGFVVETFGSGWLPENLIDVLRKDGSDCIFLVTVETSFGPQEKFYYEPTYWANDPPFISARDMTTPTAIVKLMWTLGQTDDREEVRNLLTANVADELTPGLVQYHSNRPAL